jgi:hypothetical protein
MSDELPFRSVSRYPAEVSGPAVMARLLDSLGFRFYWATEGLNPVDYDFSPGSGCMSIRELVGHVWGLVNWTCLAVWGQAEKRPGEVELQREHILRLIHRLREHLESLDDRVLGSIAIDGKPFWHLINGPMADALTHVGQINSFRRLAGALPKKPWLFGLKPPDEEP